LGAATLASTASAAVLISAADAGTILPTLLDRRVSARMGWFHPKLTADVVVHTDASGSGFGGWSDEVWFAGTWPDDYRLGTNGSSTAFIELYAVLVAVRLWAPLWRGKVVRIFCDNAASVYAWTKKSSKCVRVMGVLRSLAGVCISCGIDLLCLKWIDTKSNHVADMLSRAQGIPSESDLSKQGLRVRWPVPAFDPILPLRLSPGRALT
jgi:hypothetical protein